MSYNEVFSFVDYSFKNTCIKIGGEKFVEQTALEDRVSPFQAEGRLFTNKDMMPLGKGASSLLAAPKKIECFPKQ